MNSNFGNFRNVYDNFDIPNSIIKLVEDVETNLSVKFSEVDKTAEVNQYKVLKAMQEEGLSDTHFNWNTGYGYDDAGRDITEKIFARVFGGESALVRTGFVNGTHALAASLFGILRPGDGLVYISGKPYDTLEEVIGIRGQGMGSLMEYGVVYKQVDLKSKYDDTETPFDFERIKETIDEKTKVCAIQRATGYSWRRSITMEEISDVATYIKGINPDIIIFVDNCYGEFLHTNEPLDVGCDLMAGSLIKNPGGGLALSGGYSIGKRELVEQVSYRLSCPGIGGECGLTYGQTRTILQGLFIAPMVVSGAIKGAMLCGEVFCKLGFPVTPSKDQPRSDIIQAIQLGSKERLVSFCKGIQAAAPVDSFVKPEPWPMPGYDSDVVMAAGAFVQGSSIELSADGPVKPPYNVYFQGGMTYSHSKMGVLFALKELYQEGLLDIK
ncbi:MAG: methionine gamma-lyase family protein [Clostridiales bacterium]|nr:methionine gamma-lyase family protein [Clostridiales bacterium]